ncbi:MAG: sulfatase-like hydrolase/transferase [Thermoanaerobaculia bacterium]|nr:sulfatase-like hydrolase/transferase [Thermoanaerobaculia bacterium]
MRRSLRLAPILVAAWTVAGAGGGDERTAPDGEWNLLLVTLDTVRADALGVNGNAAAATPRLDALAASGVNFTRARSPVPLTLPAHASLLTGNLPPLHGVRDNGSYRLSDEELTLTELLRQRGYRTAAFVGSFVLDRRFGLAQGFETYDDRTWSEPAELESLEAERRGEEVYAAFARWLGGYSGAQPFFAWIHLYDPHAPYVPPEPFASRFADDPYAGEVAYTDRVLGSILDAVAARGLAGRTVVAVVGDHGEGLGEHRESTHSLLIYNSTLHVPMIVAAPGRIPAGRRVDRLTRTLDLAPTLLDYLGVATALGEARSLRAWIEPETETRGGEPDPVYSESLYAWLHLGWSPLRGLETERYRLIEAPRPELYDVVADPGETVDLAAERPDDLRRLRRRLAELEEAFPPPVVAAVRRELDGETAARLRSLGYLSTAAPAGRADVAIDPKETIETWERIQQGIALFGRGRHAEAAALFESVLETGGPLPLAHEYLGASYMALERWEEALDAYRRALAAGVDSVRLRLDLARLALGRGEVEEARRELERALALDAASVEALHLSADLERRAGRAARAERLYRRALEINPDYLYSWNGLGMLAAGRGDGEAALTAFRRAVAIAPGAAEPTFNLAVQLERMGRLGQARAVYRRVIELTAGEAQSEPRHRAAVDALARLGARSMPPSDREEHR